MSVWRFRQLWYLKHGLQGWKRTYIPFGEGMGDPVCGVAHLVDPTHSP